MKKRLLSILLFTLCCGWSVVNVCAITRTINMTVSGMLSNSLTFEEKQNITTLILTGPVDARDFKCMRDEIVKLAVLDLKEVIIEEYMGAEGTGGGESKSYKAAQIPEFAFCSNDFIGKTSLNKITLPSNLIEIGTYSFYLCSGLTGQLELPSKLTVISDFSFADCSGFTGVLELPKGLTYLGKSAFQNCSGLTGKLEIPSGINVINSKAFFNCSNFNCVELPKGVIGIDTKAFRGCGNLTDFICWAVNVPGLGLDVFDPDYKTECVLHVPFGSLMLYLGSFQWHYFLSVKEDLVTGIDETKVNDVRIYSMYNQIFVTGDKNISRVEVYDTNARINISRKEDGNRFSFRVDKTGNYIVRVYLFNGSMRTKKVKIE